MTHSILGSFDPFATHPFTNGSGVIPAPPMPSQYPIPIQSPRTHSTYPAYSSPGGPSPPPAGTLQTPPQIKAPRPQRLPSPPSQSSVTRPIFVPFRQETSSPDLVLRKKAPKTSAFTDSYTRR
ncbi:hypothetical protein DXG01_013301 [Tephrocybe rancida]|nr:hypothetical protein DXG01_013301 [Tephrocybe rancida]